MGSVPHICCTRQAICAAKKKNRWGEKNKVGGKKGKKTSTLNCEMINECKSGLHVTVAGDLQTWKPTLSIPRPIPAFIKRQSKQLRRGKKTPKHNNNKITLPSRFLMHQLACPAQIFQAEESLSSFPSPLLPEVWSTRREEQAGRRQDPGLQKMEPTEQCE